MKQQSAGALEQLVSALEQLLAEAVGMTFEMFPLNAYAHPSSTPSAWISWYTRTVKLITEFFKLESAPVALVKRGNSLARSVEGNTKEHFQEAKENLTRALEQALEATKSDVFGELAGHAAAPPGAFDPRKVFVVHGSDHEAKNELEGFLKEMGLEPIVLHRQPDEGRTIIEKFEEYSQVGFALVLLTPDDRVMSNEGAVGSGTDVRARQNVVFELGFFYGRLGRKRVCCVYKEGVTLPSDISGVVYKPFRDSVEEAVLHRERANCCRADRVDESGG